MKAASLTYHRAESIPQAIELAARYDGTSKLMAGGQSLMPMMNLRMALAEHVIDISGIAALRESRSVQEKFFLGAGVTHAMLEDGRVEDPTRGYLRHVAAGIAYRSVRNRGTIGGSLAHADPAADWPLALPALAANIVISGPAGERKVPAGEFTKGAFATVLAEDELVVAVEVPKLSASARWGYWKFCRKTGEFPESSAAMLMDPERKLARLWVGALDGAPQSLDALAAEIAQRGELAATEIAVSAALDLAVPGQDPVSRRLHVTAVRRAVQKGFS